MIVKYDHLRKVQYSSNLGLHIVDGWEVPNEYFPVIYIPIVLDYCEYDIWNAVFYRDKTIGKIKMLKQLMVPYGLGLETGIDIPKDNVSRFSSCEISEEERDDIYKQLLEQHVDIEGYICDLEKKMKERFSK